jgi:hypothetical protein
VESGAKMTMTIMITITGLECIWGTVCGVNSRREGEMKG